MNFIDTKICKSKTINIVDLLNEINPRDVREEIISGLTSDKKHISSKFFYNEKGSKLFEAITQLQEYYPTRTEIGILQRVAPKIINGEPHEIIELGSGDCKKISLFLDAIPNHLIGQTTYKPLDVSSSAILQSAKELSQRFPGLNILGYGADFTSQFSQIPRSVPALICFLGSTIGNFNPEESVHILKIIRKNMLSNDRFLLGLDLAKPTEILHAAYNDSKGITADFNKNILASINSYIQSNFDENDFDHHAFFNKIESRVEMHLIANTDVVINSPFLKQPLNILKGKNIHTENSYKFSIKDIEQMADKSGLKIKDIYTDNKEWFALVEFIR